MSEDGEPHEADKPPEVVGDTDGTSERRPQRGLPTPVNKHAHRPTRPSVSGYREALERASRQSLDYHAAWVICSAIQRRVARGLADPDRDYETIERAAEFLWDHDHRVPARDLIDAWTRCVQEAKHTDPPRISQAVISSRDTRAARLQAAQLHHDYDPVGAWTLVKATYRWLTSQAGSAGALSRLVAVAPFEDLGLQYTELLDVAVPASRGIPSSVRSAHREIFLQDAVTIIDQIAECDLERHAARFQLVNRTLFAILELRRPDADGERVRRYYALDQRLRPDDARGWATRRLVDFEVARYFGHGERAEEHARQAVADMLAAGLYLHVSKVRGQYLR